MNRLILMVLFLIGCVGVLSHSSPVEQQPKNMITLTDANFDQYTSEGNWILDFYAPWCGHCQRLSPILQEVAANFDLSNNDSPPESQVFFGLIDCTIQGELKRRFDIKGFPTILFYRNGVSRIYRSPRTVEGFTTYLKTMLTPAVNSVKDVAEMEKLMRNEQGDHRVVFLYLGPPGDIQATFQEAANQLQGVAVFVTPTGTVSKDVLEMAQEQIEKSGADAAMSMIGDQAIASTMVLSAHFNVPADLLPVIVAASPGQSNKIYSGPFDGESVRSWLSSNQLPLLSTLSPANFEEVMNGGKKTVLVVTDGQSYKAMQFTESFIPIAANYSSQYTFTTMDGTQFAQYIAQFGLHPRVLPTIFVIDYDNDLYFIDEEGLEKGVGLTKVEDQRKFLDGVLAGTIPAKATTSWYSPQRYKRMFERMIRKYTETELLIIVGVTMMVFLTIVMYGCFLLLKDDQHVYKSMDNLEKDRQKLNANNTTRERAEIIAKSKARSEQIKKMHVKPVNVTGEDAKSDENAKSQVKQRSNVKKSAKAD